MHVPNSRVRFGGWLVFALLSMGTARAQTVQLDVSEIVLKNTSKVTFVVTPSTTAVDSAQLKNALTVQTERRRFEVRIPEGDIPWLHSRQSFVYTFVVEDMQTHDRQVFDVLATPAGLFDEQYAPVPFTINRGQISEKGIVPLPIASLQPEKATVTLAGPTQRTLGFWGKQIFNVHVQNTSKLFPVTVDFNPTESVELGDVFEGIGKITRPAQTKVTIRQGQSVTFTVEVEPKWSSALSQLILPRIDAEQTTVTLKFDHQVGPFGGERGAWFSEPVEVRFQPTVFDLGGALLFGVLLGLAFRQLNLATPERIARHTPLIRRTAIILKLIVVAVVGAVVLELIALFMTRAGSRLILFGFEIDPNALLPTVVIGATAGFLGKQLGEAASKAASTVPLFGKKAAADNN